VQTVRLRPERRWNPERFECGDPFRLRQPIGFEFIGERIERRTATLMRGQEVGDSMDRDLL
jgi:hypothetical protein